MQFLCRVPQLESALLYDIGDSGNAERPRASVNGIAARR